MSRHGGTPPSSAADVAASRAATRRRRDAARSAGEDAGVPPIFAELRDHFRESTRPRIADMQLLIAAIRGDARDSRAIDQLARHFHALAGLGGSYGFPLVSTLADEGEGTAMPIARAAAAPSDSHVERWSELVAAIAREIA